MRAVATSELESASIHKDGSGQILRLSEASICQEAMFKSTGRTSRGERRQRARKEQPGTWDKPGAVSAQADKHDKGINNLVGCRIREADGFVVAMKRGNARGAKEPCWQRAESERAETDWKRELPMTEQIPALEIEAEPMLEIRDDVRHGRMVPREPDAGNLHVRFDEGEGG